MALFSVLVTRAGTAGTVTINNHPVTQQPLSLDAAREVLEACAWGALQNMGQTHGKAGRRILNQCRRAEGTAKIVVGPVTLELIPPIVVEH